MSTIDRVSVERALAWIDAATRRLGAEDTALEEATGRVVAENVCAPRAIPPEDCAAIDGYAVRAEDTLGAGAYNPLMLPAVEVASGEGLPVGSDAVVPFDHVEWDGAGRVVLVEPVAAGANVDCRGAAAADSAVLVAAGTRLTPWHIGLLASAGFASVPMVRRPRVRLALANRARSGEPVDANGPMLRTLVERDGGIVAKVPFADAYGGTADLVLIAGGTGRGRSDGSAAALSASGELDIHGVALVPGDTAGFGRISNGAPVLLLPGAPAACLWNYELFAGRAIRRLGGRDPALPYPARTVAAARKIVSAIGMTEICPIRRVAAGIEPVASFTEGGLVAAVPTDGFVIVPEASEGYPAGARVTAYFHDGW